MKIKPETLLICALVLITLFILFNKYNSSEKYDRSRGAVPSGRFSSLAYKNECEFQPACLWDTARWVQLSNGMEGVCTLHGVACPAFSKDHDRARYVGKSPTMVSNEYNTGTHASINHYRRRDNYSGETALEMLV